MLQSLHLRIWPGSMQSQCSVRDEEGWGCKIILLPVLLSFTYSTELPIWAIKLRHQHRNRKGHVDKKWGSFAHQFSTWSVKLCHISCVSPTPIQQSKFALELSNVGHHHLCQSHLCETNLCQSHMFQRRLLYPFPFLCSCRRCMLMLTFCETCCFCVLWVNSPQNALIVIVVVTIMTEQRKLKGLASNFDNKDHERAASSDQSSLNVWQCARGIS